MEFEDWIFYVRMNFNLNLRNVKGTFLEVLIQKSPRCPGALGRFLLMKRVFFPVTVPTGIFLSFLTTY